MNEVIALRQRRWESYEVDQPADRATAAGHVAEDSVFAAAPRFRVKYWDMDRRLHRREGRREGAFLTAVDVALFPDRCSHGDAFPFHALFPSPPQFLTRRRKHHFSHPKSTDAPWKKNSKSTHASIFV